MNRIGCGCGIALEVRSEEEFPEELVVVNNQPEYPDTKAIGPDVEVNIASNDSMFQAD